MRKSGATAAFDLRLAALLLGGLAVAAACAPRPPGAAPAPTAASTLPDTAALARDLPALLEVSEVPALSIAVVRDGRVIWTAAFGAANDETVFEAASLSKPVFAWLVLRLADRGVLDLDRPLAEMVEYPRLSHDPRWRRITARMALSHATGLPNWGGDTLRLAFDPGTDYRYSGEGFVLLQKALERVTGESLEQLARREVFQPLGMHRSSFVWRDEFEGNAARARNWHWYVAPVSRWAEPNAAYSLITTAGDYARFVAAVLTGRGLSAEMWSQYLTPVRETDPGIHIGLGIRVEDGPSGRRFFHSGSNGRRFTCYMSGDLETGSGFAFFTAADDGTSLVRPLASHVFGAEHPSRHWDWYERHDDPRRLALKSVRHAAVEGGADSLRARLRAVRSDPATTPTVGDLMDLGAFLGARGLSRLAVEVLRGVAEEAFDSAPVHLALGRALERAGDLEAALASYRDAEGLGDPDGEARRHIRWAEERRSAWGWRFVAPLRPPAALVGTYGERSVTLRDGRLYFGGGARPESPLVQLGPSLFELERDPGVRVRFEGDDDRPAEEIVAIQRDGGVDRWRRTR